MNENKQQVHFRIDTNHVGTLLLDSFGPGEIHLWADNYKIGPGVRIGYTNIPELDETQYDSVRAAAIQK